MRTRGRVCCLTRTETALAHAGAASRRYPSSRARTKRSRNRPQLGLALLRALETGEPQGVTRWNARRLPSHSMAAHGKHTQSPYPRLLRYRPRHRVDNRHAVRAETRLDAQGDPRFSGHSLDYECLRVHVGHAVLAHPWLPISSNGSCETLQAFSHRPTDRARTSERIERPSVCTLP